MDLQTILSERRLTTYAAARMIAATTHEKESAVQMRLGRWIKGKPPNYATALKDLDALGCDVAITIRAAGL